MKGGLDLRPWWGPEPPGGHWEGSARGAVCPPGDPNPRHPSPRSRGRTVETVFVVWSAQTWAWILELPFICRVACLSSGCCKKKKYHKLDGLNNKHYFSQLWRLGNRRSKHQQIWCVVRARFLAYKWPSSCYVLTWGGARVLSEQEWGENKVSGLFL